ncbi:hypothetical protein [Streptomyces sp. A1547]|uniref:hypothetical protein n=1 Tax=Streptomyces sp. A1547 TaxID=2563105 RepID=UPI00061FE738|nr:hypothetical protein [Streptomyces sp. A1547]KJY46197.1 hypothetical protein VR46_10475 [Streptomyces sp. NRRL S-444]THA36967.1 hypothetical protein E6W17_23320 [Streptomyces sp. A1547]
MRSTFRTAAVVAGAFTALALPATRAFAADAPDAAAEEVVQEGWTEGAALIAGGAGLAAAGAAGLGVTMLRRRRAEG